jgi:hypothetical protein
MPSYYDWILLPSFSFTFNPEYLLKTSNRMSSKMYPFQKYAYPIMDK